MLIGRCQMIMIMGDLVCQWQSAVRVECQVSRWRRRGRPRLCWDSLALLVLWLVMDCPLAIRKTAKSSEGPIRYYQGHWS
jgi:hypothetical protein